MKPPALARRLAGAGLAIGLLGAVLWWLTWHAYDPARLRSALPADAVLVSEHVSLGPRLEALLAAERWSAAGGAFGMDAAAWRAMAEADLTRWILSRLGNRLTVTAALPAAPARRDAPAWVLATWGGRHAQYLKWSLGLGLIPGFERLPGRDPIAAWRLRATNGDAPVLSLAVHRGMVLLAWSPRPDAVRELVGMLAFRDRPVFEAAIRSAAAADGAVLRWAPPPGLPRGPMARLALPALSADGLELHVAWPAAMPLPWIGPSTWPAMPPLPLPGIMPPVVPETVPSPAAGGSARAEWQHAPGGAVAAAWVAPTAYLAPRPAGARANPVALDALWAAFRRVQSGGEHLALFLLPERHSGRVFGVRTPAFVAALAVGADGDLDAGLGDLLDGVNAVFGQALIWREAYDAQRRYWVLDSGRDDVLASLRRSEKPAATVLGSWLLFGSSFQALQGWLSAEALPDDWPALWLPPEGTALWCDVAASADATRKLAALHALVRLAGAEAGGGAPASALQSVRRVLESVMPFETMEVRAVWTDGVWNVSWRLGNPSPAALPAVTAGAAAR